MLLIVAPKNRVHCLFFCELFGDSKSGEFYNNWHQSRGLGPRCGASHGLAASEERPHPVAQANGKHSPTGPEEDRPSRSVRRLRRQEALWEVVEPQATEEPLALTSSRISPPRRRQTSSTRCRTRHPGVQQRRHLAATHQNELHRVVPAHAAKVAGSGPLGHD
jgi:hypothetical protein